MKALMLALLMPVLAHAGPHAGLPIDSVYILVCKGPEGVYFIRPSGIVYAMQGMNGAANCMAVIDTEGKDHVLCHTEDSPDICELARPRSS